MKKSLAAVLCAAMVLSATACGGGSTQTTSAATEAATEATTEAVKLDPKEVYTEAMKKNAELTSMDVETDLTMSIETGEESMEMQMEMDMKADGYNTDDIKCLITSTTTADGESMDMTMFYVDGYYYMDIMGQKFKCALDPADMSEQAGADSLGMEVDVDWMSEITMEEQGDNKLIKFTGDPEKMGPYVEELLAESGSTTDAEGMEMTVTNVSGECLVNGDGYYESSSVVIELELSMEGETASMKMDMDLTYNNPGQPVEITMPDTEGYTEVDASMLVEQ